MKRTNALAEYWQQPVTGAHLQAEMERMARSSKDPAMLRELWQALGNDPSKIAQCLVQPAYVEGLVHKRYAYDERIHGALKMKAQDELLKYGTITQMQLMIGTYQEIELLKSEKKPGANFDSPADMHVRHLSQAEWDRMLHDLSGIYSHPGAHDRLAGAPKNDFMKIIPEKSLSSLQKTESRFSVVAVLKKDENKIKLAQVEWHKTSFDEWWQTAKNNFSIHASIPEFEYALPELTAGACAFDTWERTYANPYGREGHTAVWTGTEMIIWGGYGEVSQDKLPGLRYNPATDTWREISAVNAPGPRDAYTAIWAGSEMIIWGGGGCTDPSCTNYGPLNTGYRYNPVTDSWRLTSTVGAPTPRYSHFSVWTGSKMLIWGGYGNEDTTVGGKYDPATDSWLPMSTTGAPYFSTDYHVLWTGKEMIVWNLHGARYSPSKDKWTPINGEGGNYVLWGNSAVWTGTEMIVWGGEECLPFRPEPCDDTNGGALYNPVTDSWRLTSTVNTPVARAYHSAVWAGGRMIIFGGYSAYEMNFGGLYNPANNTWSVLNSPEFPVTFEYCSIISTGTEMIIWGGDPPTNTGARYKPSTNTWTPTSTAGLGNYVPYPAEYHTAVWTGTEMIEWGGGTWSESPTNQGSRYNPAIDIFFPTSLLNAPANRGRHTAVWTGTDMIVWGGYGDNVFGDGGIYNPIQDSWSPVTTINAPSARGRHTAVWANSEMIVWGGYYYPDYLSTGGRYNPNSNTWTPTSDTNAPAGRLNYTAIWTGNEMIVWGGMQGSNYLDSGARYNPVADSWSPTTTINAPGARDSHTAVWTGTEMIVWGGWNGYSNISQGSDVWILNLEPSEYYNAGGRYNPITDSWIPTQLLNAPEGRYLHTAVWSGAEMIVWGGYGLGAYYDSGAKYDPVADSWSPTTTINAPEGRLSHTAVWTGTRMIIWGGTGGGVEGGLYCAPYPNFSIACSPSTVEMLPGGNASVTCTITSSYNFSQPVTLSCDNPPTGISYGFNPNPVTPPVNGTVTSTITISALANTVPGSYGLWIEADSDTLSYKAPVHVNILTPTNLRVGKVLVDVHSSSGNSNVNGLLEPGETVLVEPQWTNTGGSNAVLNGTVTVSQVPSWAQVNLIHSTADYGTIAPGATTSCYDATSSCYEIQLQTVSQRTGLHSDVILQEALNDASSHLWSVHVGASFSDIPVTYMFYKYIEKLLHANVTAGCTATQYCPNLAVNREQAAKYLCASMGTVIPDACALLPCQGIFSDVLLSNVFCPHIESLYENGIITGCDSVPMKYCPQNALRRQEAAKLICMSMDAVNPQSCLATPNPPCTGIFTDVTTDNPFCPYIEALYNAGVLSGCTANTFCPTATVTRGQIAKLLSNSFSL